MKVLTLTTALIAALAAPVLATETSDQPTLTVVASQSGPTESLADRIHAQLAAESSEND